MLISDQLGLVNCDVFGQGILEIGQGKVKEFYFIVCGNPVTYSVSRRGRFFVIIKRSQHMLLCYIKLVEILLYIHIVLILAAQILVLLRGSAIGQW